MILAGDIGGTNTELALFDESGDVLRLVGSPSTFRSGDYENVESLVEEYLDEANKGAPEIACFGVAGPVRRGRVKATNLAWELTEETLVQAIGARSQRL